MSDFVPLTVATAFASAIVRGGFWLEPKMRPAAKDDVAAFLRNANLSGTAAHIVYSAIYDAFISIFGEKHWTVKCLLRSIAASVVFLVVMASVVYQGHQRDVVAVFEVGPGGYPATDLKIAIDYVLFLIVVCLVPDYISVMKARFTLHLLRSRSDVFIPIGLLLADVIASIFLSYAGFVAYASLMTGKPLFSALNVVLGMKDAVRIMAGLAPCHRVDVLFAIVLFSTVMTSLWACLVVLSSVALKGTISIDYAARVVRWMFCISTQPILAISVMLAGISWMLLVAWDIALTLH